MGSFAFKAEILNEFQQLFRNIIFKSAKNICLVEKIYFTTYEQKLVKIVFYIESK
jgi:hypothetical protein